MKVILQADVKGHGKKGQLVEVADGYGRNYLIPRGLAVAANSENLNVLKSMEAAKAQKLQRQREEATEQAKKLSGITVKITAKGGAVRQALRLCHLQGDRRRGEGPDRHGAGQKENCIAG